jgi:hypothetical protein
MGRTQPPNASFSRVTIVILCEATLRANPTRETALLGAEVVELRAQGVTQH